MRSARYDFCSLAVAGLVCGVQPTWAEWGTEFAGPSQLTHWVHALAWYRGRLIMGGEASITTDSVRVNCIASWDGTRWSSLGGGVTYGGCPGPACWPIVRALTPYGDGLLVVGGSFIRAGGEVVNHVAAWDGAAWRAFGSGVDGRVSTVLAQGSDVYVGGSFTTAGGLAAENVARWDGTRWHAMGTELCCGFVEDLAWFEGKLVAAGQFLVSGTQAGIASWDGLAWRPIYVGDSGSSISALTVFNDSLVAGGHFFDDGVPSSVGRWDGNTWTPIGTEENQPPGSELAVFRGSLIAAGNQGTAGANLHVWKERIWAPFQSGVNDAAFALLALDSTLFVGGRFTEAGGIPSTYVGRWTEPRTPVLLQDFRATIESAMTVLSWRLGALDGVRSVQVQRAITATGPFEPVSPLFPPQTERFRPECCGNWKGRSLRVLSKHPSRVDGNRRATPWNTLAHRT